MPKKQKQRKRSKTVIEKQEKGDKKTTRKVKSEDSIELPVSLLTNEITDEDTITELVQWKSKTSLSEESLDLNNNSLNDAKNAKDDKKVTVNRPIERPSSPITYKTTIILHPEQASQPHYQRVTTLNVKRDTPPRIIETSSQTNKVNQLDEEANTVEWLISSVIILAIALLLIRFF
ncbi:uncharacterized protein LOC107362181 [Tetranychus urticae]|uniref:uncharacterized protein LOC107362181 n=1 Tax=Tetranychus urticae TaxID=32264 RepID=UPI00077BA5B0|nr:uncharacterized protein LOC107362181 [Tetranychus urticae]